MPSQTDTESAPVEPESASILERRWNLVLYTSLDGNQSEPLPLTAREFETRGSELDGVVNCNGSSGGTYQLNENSVIFNFGPATEIDCGLDGDQFREQESSLQDLLSGQGESANNSRELMIDLVEDMLTLTAPNGRNLVFREILSSDNPNTDVANSEEPIVTEASVENIIWSLNEYTSSTGEQATLMEDTVYQFLAPSETGKLQGMADCNFSSGGSYQLGDDTIVLEFGPFEEAECVNSADETYIRQNSTVQDLLIRSQNNPRMYSFESDALVLTLPDGRYMVFDKVAEFSNR